MSKIILPRPYLSYSAISLWEKNKEGYRKRYYDNVPTPDTPETLFGKKIAKLLETNDVASDPILSKIPRYSHPEHKMEVIIGDVPILGFLDSFDMATGRILEYKTGHDKPNGQPAWDAVAVAKTEQLPVYSLLVKEKYGSVDNVATLVWMKTIKKPKVILFDGHELKGDGYEMELDRTFEPKIFERKIFEYERQFIKDKIIRVAHEIAEDYDRYKKASIERALQQARA